MTTRSYICSTYSLFLTFIFRPFDFLCLARLKSWCRAPCLASRKRSRWQHTPVPRSFLTGWPKVWPELKSNRTLKSHSISSRFHPDEATNIRDMLVTRHAELRLRIHGAVRSPVHMAPRTLMDSRSPCPHSAMSLPQCDPTRPSFCLPATPCAWSAGGLANWPARQPSSRPSWRQGSLPTTTAASSPAPAGTPYRYR